jgi:hypothetical protein
VRTIDGKLIYRCHECGKSWRMPIGAKGHD